MRWLSHSFIGNMRSSLVLVAINDFKQPAGWVCGCLQLKRIMGPHGNRNLIAISNWNKPTKHNIHQKQIHLARCTVPVQCGSLRSRGANQRIAWDWVNAMVDVPFDFQNAQLRPSSPRLVSENSQYGTVMLLQSSSVANKWYSDFGVVKHAGVLRSVGTNFVARILGSREALYTCCSPH